MMDSANATSSAGFGHAARIQIRVIKALLLREMQTRFGRQNLGFMWLMCEPLLFAFPVIGLWMLIRPSHEHGISLLPFVWTGYLPLLLFRHVIGSSLGCVRSNTALLYHRQVTVYDVFYARMFLEIVGNLLAFMFGYVLFVTMGLMRPVYDWGLVLAGYGFLAWFSIGLGMVVCYLIELSEIAEKAWAPIGYLSAPLSGAFFMVEFIPEPYRDAVLWIPLVHPYEILRAGFLGPSVKTFYDPTYIGTVCGVLTILGLLGLGSVRKNLTLQ